MSIPPSPSTTEAPPLYLGSRWLREHYGLSQAEVEKAWRNLPTYRIADSRYIKVRRDEFEVWLERFRRTPQDRRA